VDRSVMKRVAIHARVSTASQAVEIRFQKLHAVARRNGWIVVAIQTGEASAGLPSAMIGVPRSGNAC
jgi:hypothetical protein